MSQSIFMVILGACSPALAIRLHPWTSGFIHGYFHGYSRCLPSNTYHAARSVAIRLHPWLYPAQSMPSWLSVLIRLRVWPPVVSAVSGR
ncbi:hypothetical protein SLEP1_g52915 [Rubroshorea leprosula]|uniref:Secreted protein n=1 Tax=Rubroshorea leprosula TaxID=152421 RepID=A0AAV5M8W4_9ROSI|nr:hypothetical protein SLEP1_g52915 [Rubroshorea leprosula]